ncbi:MULTISPECIES: ribosome maturation factor RimP [Cysteiniphilum]|uniref:ribosome maturation factor RimP n=1 Tax=Cysteiniphilum TaxID=2056696 RepID=UPI001780CF6F|nr:MULTISPECIES: ribosome maturation factor RimP [Cysteiniphilum]
MLVDQLEALIAPEVESLGFILWGIEMDAYSADTGSMTLRIFIDHEEGISVDDCQEVSRAVGAILDVEDPISGAYSLEVSSPGVNRRVFNALQAKALEGFEVKVQLHQATENNRRRFKGVIISVDNDEVVVKTEEDEEIRFDFHNVDKMRVVPKF